MLRGSSRQLRGVLLLLMERAKANGNEGEGGQRNKRIGFAVTLSVSSVFPLSLLLFPSLLFSSAQFRSECHCQCNSIPGKDPPPVASAPPLLMLVQSNSRHKTKERVRGVYHCSNKELLCAFMHHARASLKARVCCR